MKTFFISDTHFGHTKVIRYSGRPFVTVDEMDRQMVANWNAVVAPEDHVYHLGDLMWHATKKSTATLLDSLNGRKTLIVGNHDHRPVRNSDRWFEVHKLLETEVDGRHVTLCHYPIAHWAGQRKGGVHLHGHMHGTREGFHRGALDVGVDLAHMAFTPRTLDELLPHFCA